MGQTIAYYIIKAIFACMGILPKSWRDRLGDALGKLIYRFDHRHRKVVMKNLEIAFGNEKSQDEIKDIALKCFKNLGRICFDIGWISVCKRTLDFYEVQGAEHLYRAHQQGKGVLLLSAHFGNWELLREAGYFIQKNYGWVSSIVARQLDFYPLERFFLEVRARYGTLILQTRKRPFRTIIRLLKNKKHKNHVVLLNDQRVDWYEGVFVDFFGHLACTNTGLARLAKQIGAPVVPLYVIRTEKGFIGQFQPEIPWIDTGDEYWDLAENTLKYNQNIEAMIRKYPEQWFWVHNRWKTHPSCPWPKP
ncbi:Bacterial lipid A biosynthesis acyltransferase [Candidatus Magnetomorum sp. HK-1]|nr:Bacterial lipid A biosynthesis acyltransferase [Candidatus Magnetomorum sp. HK-1]